MSRDPIRAALDAAVTGYDMARVLSHGGVWPRDQMSPANAATIRPMIADAIADFFEALPPHAFYLRIDGRVVTVIDGSNNKHMADAVEKAARDE